MHAENYVDAIEISFRTFEECGDNILLSGHLFIIQFNLCGPCGVSSVVHLVAARFRILLLVRRRCGNKYELITANEHHYNYLD